MKLPEPIQDLLNDLLHLLWGAAFVLLPWLALGLPEPESAWFVASATGIALAHALVIELVKETPDSWDTARDLAGYALGGAISGIVVLFA